MTGRGSLVAHVPSGPSTGTNPWLEFQQLQSDLPSEACGRTLGEWVRAVGVERPPPYVTLAQLQTPPHGDHLRGQLQGQQTPGHGQQQPPDRARRGPRCCRPSASNPA